MKFFKQSLSVILICVMIFVAVPFVSSAYSSGQYTTTAVLNVRASASTSAEIIGKLASGTSVSVVAVSNGNWGKINYNGKIGWICLDYAYSTAAKQYSTSAAGLALIKSFEGFSATKYWDYTQWSIGYGSACGENDYPYGITEAEASVLLASVIGNYEAYLDSFLASNNIMVSQNQYDALVSLTYNLGNLWTKYPDSDLVNILKNGASNYTAQEIKDAFGVFRKAGGTVNSGLVARRTAEAEYFLTGMSDLPFVDVVSSAWYYTAIKHCYENGIMRGLSSAYFNPNSALTRAMVVTILGVIEDVDISKYMYTSFTDVTLDQYYGAYVQWAYDKGITSGMGKGIFWPNVAISRQDMLCMLYRYAQYKGIKTSVASSSAYMNFNDGNNLSSYAVAAVNWAVNKSIVVGDEYGYLKPQKNLTRAEAAQIMYVFSTKILRM